MINLLEVAALQFAVIIALITALAFMLGFYFHRVWTNKQTILFKKKYESKLMQFQMGTIENSMANMARELHDNVGQYLTAIKFSLINLETDINKNALDKFNNVYKLTENAILESRAMISKLVPLYQGEKLISENIQELLDQIEKGGQYSTKLSIAGSNRMLPRETHIIIFRITQEVLNNIIKHADANRIEIEINFEKERFTLKIADNGKGFNVEKVIDHQTGMGLHNLHKRAALINAVIQITSTQRGTIVKLEMPVIA